LKILKVQKNIILKNNENDTFVKQLSYETLKRRVGELSLELISAYEEYRNKNSILKCKCFDCGFEFIESYINLIRRQSPCPNCKKSSRRLTEKLLKTKAHDLGLKLLSDYSHYKNYNTILKWTCLECYYEFHDSMENISRREFSCNKCKENQRKEGKLKKFSMGYKKCIKCRKILHFSKFYENRSYCEECLLKQRSFRMRRKFKIIYEVFNGVCDECGIDLVWLPAFVFHHPNRQLKTEEWAGIIASPYNKIIEWVKHDKVLPLCRNCHELISTKYFDDFRHIILRKNISILDKANINTVLNAEINSPKLKFELKKWLRKRYIIERIFNGVCAGCENVNVFSNLPALTFHHRDPSKKKTKISNLLNLSCEKLNEIIIGEEIICLCGNCHSLIHSNYLTYLEPTLEKIISEPAILTFKLRISKIFSSLNENIKCFRYKAITIKNLF
jgi:predicted Zn-ribbon and HTH transcriptional regulator